MPHSLTSLAADELAGAWPRATNETQRESDRRIGRKRGCIIQMLNYQSSAFGLENDSGMKFVFAGEGSPLTTDYAAIVPAFTKHHLMLPKFISPLAAAGKGVLVKLFLCVPR
jgi:hypothetical protein